MYKYSPVTPPTAVRPAFVMALTSLAVRRRAALDMMVSGLLSSIHVLFPYTKTYTIKKRMHAEADREGWKEELPEILEKHG